MLDHSSDFWLNLRVARSGNKRPGKSGEGTVGKLLAVVLLLAFVAGGGWLWWRSRQQPPPSKPIVNKPVAVAPGPKVVVPPRTNAPAVVTNLPPPKTNIVVAMPPAQPKPPTQPPPTSSVPTVAVDPALFPRMPRDIFEAQVALARRAVSSGSIDGVMGSQTRAALLAFQRQHGLAESLELNDATRAALQLDTAPLTTYTITTNDVARLQPVSKTWLGKSQQTALDYETILELVAERGHASPTLIRRLNPTVDWTNVVAGTEIQLPDVQYTAPAAKAGFVVISLSEKKLEAFDANTNLLAHFPCSIAARVEKRPAGELHVTAIAENPNYTLNPDVFPESPEVQALNRKLILPPGPNNPVGTAWISLDKPGYGMHGTPGPEQVGRTESHGCFRLANWNASHLVKLVWIGMPVYIEP